MIHIGYSGGGLKGIGHLGIAEILDNNSIKPIILSGISVGSIIALLHALVLSDLITWKQVREVFFKIESKQVFSTHPYSIKGIIRGLLSFIIKDYHSLGKQDALDNLIRSVITKSVYDKYKNNTESPEVYVGYVDYKKADIVIERLKDYNYESAIRIILASSHVPIATESIKLFGSYGYDGGLIDHCISGYIIEKYSNKLSLNINVFSRPKESHLTDESWKPKNICNVLVRTAEIGVYRISKDDEKYIDLLSKYYMVKNYNIYLPNILDNMYSFDHSKLYQLYLAGRKQAFELIAKLKY